MANLTFEFVSQCAASDPHLTFRVLINGVERDLIVDNQSKIQSGDVIEPREYRAVAWAFLRSFVIKWFEDNPGGSLAALQTALEAESWRV